MASKATASISSTVNSMTLIEFGKVNETIQEKEEVGG